MMIAPARHIASCSFGKDSIATILLALENNEPLTDIVFAEVMFDKARGISGEHPKHIEWVKNIAIPKLQTIWGGDIHILHSKHDYLERFNDLPKGKYYPSKRGFPIGGKCEIQKVCKMKPINDFYKNIQGDITQYVGIAVNETERLKRMKQQNNRVSLLEKYQYTEDMAMWLCEKYGLLSPIYTDGEMRNGCWFCMNYRIGGLTKFYKEYPELWNELRILGDRKDTICKGYKYGKTVAEVEAQILERIRKEEYEKLQLKLFE